MPHLTLDLSSNGPVIDLLVSVSSSREAALKASKQAVPNPVKVRGLIDTGASCTAVDPGVLDLLGLTTPTSTTSVHTPSTGDTPHQCNQFDVGITLLHTSLNLVIGTVPVIESKLAKQGIHALLGRDILSRCLFFYNGAVKRFALAF